MTDPQPDGLGTRWDYLGNPPSPTDHRGSRIQIHISDQRLNLWYVDLDNPTPAGGH